MGKKCKKILTIGGGNGQFVLLSGLRDIKDIEITTIVSMADSGGSSGRLRDELGALPPGDALKCILALSPKREIARELLLKRFVNDRRLRGHNAGNMLLTMLSRYTGSFPYGVRALAEILDVNANILPVTIDKVTLVAELRDGTRIFGETAIDMPSGIPREKIRDVFLVPHHTKSISVYPPVIEAIERADYILIGPGDLFTSIIPNFIFPGIKEAFQKSDGVVLYITNIMTKYGETDNFTASDFVVKLEEVVQRRIDKIIYNTNKPKKNILEKYKAHKSEFVEMNSNTEFWENRNVHRSDLLDVSEEIVRHSSKKLSMEIKRIIFNEQ
jgi:uncharacterized cofD-like protein